MANRYRAIVDVEVGGEQRRLRFDLNALAEIEDRLQLDGITEVFGRLEKGSIKTLRVLLWAGLLHEAPDLTEREVGAWDVDLTALAPLLAEALKLSFGVAGTADGAGAAGSEQGNAERSGVRPGAGARR